MFSIQSLVVREWSATGATTTFGRRATTKTFSPTAPARPPSTIPKSAQPSMCARR